ncbi:restriction endonuclease [Leifsonia aquatica]|uniref:restriction endonuclease n=1 Tax=Leifsonia aquatica TaxID=144185 RepID=UPI0038267524
MFDSSTPGRGFEDYIRYVYQAILNCESQDIKVLRGARVPNARGDAHFEIDVYYEFDLAGVRHRVAMECKDTRRPVERNDVLAFCQKLQDMPSTIGIFISRNGFQSGAERFLDEKGILHFDSTTAPSMRDAVAAIIVAAALPSESSIGQPFWGLMEEQDGEGTGSWLNLPPGGMGKNSPALFPLFFSKPDASLFQRLSRPYSEQTCIRGIPQTTLRSLLLISHQLLPTQFAVMRPFEKRGRTLFEAHEASPLQLAEQYLPEGTARFARKPE